MANEAQNQYYTNPFGIPNPDYSPTWNQDMAFAPEMDKRLQMLNMNTQGLDKFRNQAMRSGPSMWASLMTNKSFADDAAMKDRAVTQSRAGVRTAEADLASKGGLSSGARERVARGGARDLLSVGQDTARTGNMNRMQIGINDEQNRISQLSQLPGMENTVFQGNLQKESMWDNARKTDIQAAMEENNRRNQYNQNIYNQQLQAAASNRQAAATENSGKK